MSMRFLLAGAAAAIFVASASAAGAADGKAIYANVCAACHQPDGAGTAGLAPPLVSAVVVRAAEHQKDYLAAVVTKGLSGPIGLADGSSLTSAMPVQSALSDADVAAALNYVLKLNHKSPAFSAADVAAVRGKPISGEEVRHMRAELLK
jgi:mono/diheme cytochrome c family protein